MNDLPTLREQARAAFARWVSDELPPMCLRLSHIGQAIEKTTGRPFVRLDAAGVAGEASDIGRGESAGVKA